MSEKTPIVQCSECRGTAAEAVVDWNHLPVPCFGDPANPLVKIATIGLNPAANEPQLPKLTEYHKHARKDLSPRDVVNCELWRERYFAETEWHNYFNSLDALLGRINPKWSYARNAVHIDLVACSTTSKFGNISQYFQQTLIKKCRLHFFRTLARLPKETILFLNGETVCDEVLSHATFEVGPELIVTEPKLVGWRGSVMIAERQYKFRGWNIPVAHLNPLERIELAGWLRTLSLLD